MAYNPFDQNWDSLNPFKRPEVDTSEADAAAAYQAMIDKKKEDARIAIEEVFNKYGETDYQRIRDARADYEDIELTDQYKDALQDMEYALARAGRKGSTNLRARADAAKEWKKQKMESARRGNKDVENYKIALPEAKDRVDTLNVGNADPAMMADLASRRLSGVSGPAVYEPLVDVFASITKGLATKQEIEDRKRLMNQYGGNYA